MATHERSIHPDKASASSIRLDLTLFLTVPLGYYVPWMNWLAWINVVGLVSFYVFMSYVLVTKVGEIHRTLDEAGYKVIPTTWKVIVPFASCFFVAYFGWHLSAWMMAGSMVIYHVVMRTR